MPDSRQQILASIRASLAGARHLPAAPVGALPGLAPAPSAETLADQFAAELTAVGGVFVAERADRVPALVVSLVRERKAEAVLAWQAESLPVPGVLDTLRREGIALPGVMVPSDEPARGQRLAELDSLTVGLTGADAALADTGTLALRSGPGRPRLASLSVRTHIAVFTTAQLYASWAAWWSAEKERLAGWVGEASNVTLVTGPSRTADIEMTLTVGVHGPAEVIAILALG